MNKFLLSLFAIFTATASYALPVGNPSEASLLTNGVFFEETCADFCDPYFNWCEAWSFRLGFYGDYVFDRHLKTKRKGAGTNMLRKTEITTNAAYFALNLCDCFDIFATLGTTHFRMDAQESNFEIIDLATDDALVFETDTHFSWSVGVRGTIWECGALAVGGEFQYFRACPDLNYLLVYNEPTKYFAGESFKYHEWQFAFGVSYQVEIVPCSASIIPYAAIKAGKAKADMGNVIIDSRKMMFDLENDRCVGYAIGMTLVGCDCWSATIEGRFIDELALYFNTQFRF